MSHVVILLSPDQISNVKRYYSAHLLEKLPPGSLFAARLQSCTITAYKSGKVLFKVMRQTQKRADGEQLPLQNLCLLSNNTATPLLRKLGECR